ncbi:AAC(3) family N-acetyltransferase [Rhizobium leguminosarum]|uniref:Aminoglycoside N(3)-acetyltransferase n=1 Tax=Rhizobium leguminosarum TaxID=384 RepID=A0A2K9YYF7_RHILE|nr:AAC(3) family N-acetyltransferase [Rhizobium leguminosarum]AUW40891.1 hypothetical protein CUJ84_Chr000477 [Rhizobium leguminosarum]
MFSMRQTGIAILRKIVGRKDVRSHIRLRKLAFEKWFYREKYSTEALREAFAALQVSKGRTVWLQTSWNEFYNYDQKPSTIIDLLLEMIGPEGTLVMPAIPLNFEPEKLFVVELEPVSTGLICEVFRRYPGVKRSIHLSSSVIALGPNAEYLTRDHHLTETAWDAASPYQRLMELDALCVVAGVGPRLASMTPLHAVEAILRHELPFFAAIFHGSTTYRWKSLTRKAEGQHTFLHRHGHFDAGKFARHFPRDIFKERRVSNLRIWSAPVRETIEIGLELGRRGISMYK